MPIEIQTNPKKPKMPSGLHRSWGGETHLEDKVSEMTTSPSQFTSLAKSTTAALEDPALSTDAVLTCVNCDPTKTKKKTANSDGSADNLVTSSKQDADNLNASGKQNADNLDPSGKQDADKLDTSGEQHAEKVSEMSSMQPVHLIMLNFATCLQTFLFQTNLFVGTFAHSCCFVCIRLCIQSRQPSQEEEDQGNRCALRSNDVVNTCG